MQRLETCFREITSRLTQRCAKIGGSIPAPVVTCRSLPNQDTKPSGVTKCFCCSRQCFYNTAGGVLITRSCSSWDVKEQTLRSLPSSTRVCVRVCRQLCFCATATLCVVKGTVSQVAVGDPCFPQTSVVKHTSRKTVTSVPLHQHLLAVPSSDSVVVGDTRGSNNTKLILFLLDRRTH